MKGPKPEELSAGVKLTPGDRDPNSKEAPVEIGITLESFENLFDLYETLGGKEKALIDSARQIAFDFLQREDAEGLKKAIKTTEGTGRFPLYDVEDQKLLKKISRLFSKEIAEQIKDKKIRAPETKEQTEQIEKVMERYTQTADKMASFCEEYLQELRGQEEYSALAKGAVDTFEGELRVSEGYRRSAVTSKAWIRWSTIDFTEKIKQTEDTIAHMEENLVKCRELAGSYRKAIKEDLENQENEEQ